MVDRLTQRLTDVWTVRAHDGHGELYLPKFAPRGWVAEGELDRGRVTVLRSAGWEIQEINGQRYLIPDEELTRYALGWAYEDYLRVIGGLPSPSPQVGEGRVRGGEYADLVDAILYSDALAREERLSSGARILYPGQFSSVGSGNIEQRVETALRGGWVMVGLITESDLFLLPPESIARGSNVTADDSIIGRGVLQELRKRGLISLRGKGFGGGSVSPVGFSLPLRTAHGEEWKKMVEEQQARWGSAEIKPVVDLGKVSWLSRFPALQQWLEGYRAYVEPFDLMRIKFFVDAWSGTADIDVLENMVGGIKGVLGEIAARPGIVEEYRRSQKSSLSQPSLPLREGVRGRGTSVLFFAPQILSGRDVLERSDALVARVDTTSGETVIERVWEVITTDGGPSQEHATEQNAASLGAYQNKGIIFRRSDGRSCTFTNVTMASGEIGEVVTARDTAMEEVLGQTREALVTEMGIDLITERVRGKFSPTFEELKVMMREERGVERLIEILGGYSREGRSVLVGYPLENRVYGLRIVSETEAGKFGHGYFHLGFDLVEGRLQLRSASGKGALDLAAEWVEQRIGRGLDPVERSFLGGLLGTTTQSKVAEEKATFEKLGAHLKEHGIDCLVKVMRAVGQSPPLEGRAVLVGVSKGDKVSGLRLVSEAEAGKFSEQYFHLGFDWVEGRYELRSASGASALDLGVEWVEQRIGRGLDPVERSFLGGLLGTRTQSKVAEEKATFEKLGAHLKEHGIDCLVKVMRAVGQSPPLEGRSVLVGYPQGGKVSGLRLVSEAEAEGLHRNYFRIPFELVGGRYQLDSERVKGGRKLLALIFPERKPSGPKLSSLGAGTLDDAYWGVHDWWQETRGGRLPATKENLARHGLLEPATIRGRAIRYLPGEGVAGLVAVFAAPVVTERLFQINPHRNPGGFHAANLGALHFLNATGGAIADVIPQIGRGASAVRVGREVVTSSSLSRTFLRSTGQRLVHVGGLAEGTVWAYPGYVAGDELTGLVTDNPTARAISGGVGAIGVPVGLKIWLGEQGMSKLAATAVGRAAGPVGAVLLAKDVGAGAYETMTRQDLEDAEVALRERAINELSWIDRQMCNVSEALFMSGVGIILGAPGVVACERSIAAKMDALDSGSRHLRFRASPANLQQFRSRITFP